MELETQLRQVLGNQYDAALSMLERAVETCPEELWMSGEPCAFWRIAYHAAFYTHLYLSENETAFRAWEHHREDYQFLGPLPWPPHRMPKIGEAYEREQVLGYVRQCAGMVNRATETLDLAARESGFWWYKVSKLELQLVNLRHIQHHTGQLAARLRAGGATGLAWAGGVRSS